MQDFLAVPGQGDVFWKIILFYVKYIRRHRLRVCFKSSAQVFELDETHQQQVHAPDELQHQQEVWNVPAE